MICGRCGADEKVTASLEVFGRRVGAVDLCAGCETALHRFLAGPQRAARWNDDPAEEVA